MTFDIRRGVVAVLGMFWFLQFERIALNSVASLHLPKYVLTGSVTAPVTTIGQATNVGKHDQIRHLLRDTAT